MSRSKFDWKVRQNSFFQRQFNIFLTDSSTEFKFHIQNCHPKFSKSRCVAKLATKSIVFSLVWLKWSNTQYSKELLQVVRYNRWIFVWFVCESQYHVIDMCAVAVSHTHEIDEYIGIWCVFLPACRFNNNRKSLSFTRPFLRLMREKRDPFA